MHSSSLLLSLPSPKQSEVLQRLLLAKQLYAHGRDHGRQYDSLNRMIAIHDLHNALEIALRAILYASGSEEMNSQFEAVLKLVNRTAYFTTNGLVLPDIDEIVTFSRVRNLVQHRAFVPASDVARWMELCSSAMSWIFNVVFGKSLQELSPLILIRDDGLRMLLTRAGQHLEGGAPTKCRNVASMTFDAATESLFDTDSDLETESQLLVGNILYGSDLSTVLESIGSTHYDTGVLHSTLNALAYRAVRAERLAIVLSTGVSLTDYRRYSKTADAKDDLVKNEDAFWMLDFVMNAIINWQSSGFGPSLPEHWRLTLEHELAGSAIGEAQMQPEQVGS